MEDNENFAAAHELEIVKRDEKAPPFTPLEALLAAPTVHEVLGRPDLYDRWYKGMRQEALDNA